MSNIKETIYLVCSEVTENHNKYWKGILYEDGEVYTEWGRVGDSKPGKKSYPGRGKSFLDTKVRAKKKGKINKKTGKLVCYTEAKIVGDDNGATSQKAVNQGSVQQVARRDIQTKSPQLTRLVDRLIKSNIHNITTSTNITYNSTTGLFSTPLGIVDQASIDDARGVLDQIKTHFEDRSKMGLLKDLTAEYMRLIPHDVGRKKLRVDLIFPNDNAIQKELGILDSLEVSLDTMQTAPAPKTGSKPAPKVFDVDLGIVEPTAREFKRLTAKFNRSNKSMHHYDSKKVVNIYSVDLGEMSRRYDSGLGNDTEVFHGTSEANLLSILKSGLKIAPPSTAHIAGKMFGNGVYGSETASKALGYSLGRWGGSSSTSGWIFICDFAMGKAYYPNGYATGSPPRGYDSTWALPKNTSLYNDELIVYRDSQVRIRALLEIK